MVIGESEILLIGKVILLEVYVLCFLRIWYYKFCYRRFLKVGKEAVCFMLIFVFSLVFLEFL